MIWINNIEFIAPAQQITHTAVINISFKKKFI